MKSSEFLPLQEPTFFILLSLTPGAKHGYAILQDVETLSGGRVRLGTGTLYGALSRLLDQDLIERMDEDDPPADRRLTDSGRADGGRNNHPGRSRKIYRLTRAGREILRAEIARMQSLVSAAHRQFGEQMTG